MGSSAFKTDAWLRIRTGDQAADFFDSMIRLAAQACNIASTTQRSAACRFRSMFSTSQLP